MKSLRIVGLRSLVDTGAVALRPITVLLGENSSGKSTFLRTFPLLRQSIEVPTNEPLLWYGRYVDFGSFEEALSRNSRKKEIEIELEIDLDLDYGQAPSRHSFDNVEGQDEARATINVQISNDPSDPDAPDYVSKVILNAAGYHVELSLSPKLQIERLALDGEDFTETARLSYFFDSTYTIVPRIFSIPEFEEVHEDGEEESATQISIDDEKVQSFEKSLESLIKREAVHGRVKDESIRELAQRLRLRPPAQLLSGLKQSQSQTGVWRRQVDAWTVETPEFLRLQRLLLGARLENLLDASANFLRLELTGISYITPLRAVAERYYRTQGLAVDELDSKGENFALFLRSLDRADRERLRKWLASALDVYVILKESRGHVSLYLVDEKSGQEVNLADTGFGLHSQVLPIIVQLWMTQGSRRRKRPGYPRMRGMAKIIVIEQPELHLHPRIQAKVADLLVDTVARAKERDADLVVIIETHSEAIVNRLGKHVAEGKLRPEDVNIVLFEKAGFADPTVTKSAHFDGSGFLQEWPVGFFNAD